MLWTRGADRTVALRALSRPGRRVHTIRGVSSTPRDKHSSQASGSTSTAETHATGPLPRPAQAQESVTSPPPIDVGALRDRFREWGVLASSSLGRHADQFSETASATFSRLGLHLNRMTGYEQIEALKREVVAQEARIKAARRTAREAKTAYEDAVSQRAVSQRRVNDLLQRKSSWSDADVGDFTSLVRADHAREQAEARAQAHVTETEDAVERAFSELMRVILARYHEEQVWSDKIRSASTYGSLAVLGVNLVVFVMAIVVVEPWKRRRLAQTFERKVEEMGAETKALVEAGATRLDERLTVHEKLLTELIGQVSVETRQGPFTLATVPQEASPEGIPVPAPSWWWSQVYFSSPHLGVIRAREVILVVGSAAAGGVITLLTRNLFN